MCDQTPTWVNESIAELRKKITLAESRQKAQFEEWESEKRRNIEKTKRLKEEIKQLYEKLAVQATIADNSKRCWCSPKRAETVCVQNSVEERKIEQLDEKVAEARKKLDLLRHRVQEKQKQLHWFTEESRAKPTKKNRNFNSAKPFFSKKESQQQKRDLQEMITDIENQIQLTETKSMEAQQLNKMYRGIQRQLTEEKVKYEWMLKKLDKNIQDQQCENLQLMGIKKQTELLTAREDWKKEETALREEREKQKQNLHQIKSAVENCKSELEQLERGSLHEKKAPLLSLVPEMSDEESKRLLPEIESMESALESVFAVLREAAGAVDNEGVLYRYKAQMETRKALFECKIQAEKDKSELAKKKQQILKTLQEEHLAENGQQYQPNEGLLEGDKKKLEREIHNWSEKLENVYKEKQRVLDHTAHSMNKIYRLCSKLMGEENVSGKLENQLSFNEVMSLLHVLKAELQMVDKTKMENADVKSVLKEEPKLEENLQREKGQQKRRESVYRVPLTVFSTRTSELEEEENVPTRNSLKTEAQLIYESRSRRKALRIHSAKEI